MSFSIILAACFLACVQPIYSASASFITKCNLDDSKCLKSSTQAVIPIFAAGLPDLGIEKLDPFFIKSIDASSPSLKLKLSDITGTGLSQCIAKKIQFNADKTKLTVKLLCTVDAKGIYDIDGNVLVLNIVGNGNAHVVLRNLLIHVEAFIKEVTGADGAPHWKISKWQHSYELKEKATVELDNLFNGNDVLGRAAKELIANSPNEIVTELGPPIVKACAEKIVKNVNVLFTEFKKSELAA